MNCVPSEDGHPPSLSRHSLGSQGHKAPLCRHCRLSSDRADFQVCWAHKVFLLVKSYCRSDNIVYLLHFSNHVWKLSELFTYSHVQTIYRTGSLMSQIISCVQRSVGDEASDIGCHVTATVTRFQIDIQCYRGLSYIF